MLGGCKECPGLAIETGTDVRSPFTYASSPPTFRTYRVAITLHAAKPSWSTAVLWVVILAEGPNVMPATYDISGPTAHVDASENESRRSKRHHPEVLTLTGDSLRTRQRRQLLAMTLPQPFCTGIFRRPGNCPLVARRV